MYNPFIYIFLHDVHNNNDALMIRINSDHKSNSTIACNTYATILYTRQRLLYTALAVDNKIKQLTTHASKRICSTLPCILLVSWPALLTLRCVLYKICKIFV